MGATLKDIFSVFKLRIGVTIAFSALAGWAVTPGPSLPGWKIALLWFAVLGSAASAGAYNQFVERDLDARMARTKNRPFVNGTFEAGSFWLGIICALLIASVGAAAIALNMVAALYIFCGAFVYGVVYTVWLKRRTWLNIVIGGLSGSFAVLAGAAAVDPGLSAVPVILAIVLFLWTPPHFWSLAMALREDYAAANVPMLPVVVGDDLAAKVILGHTAALVALSFLPLAYGLGWIYLVSVMVGGALFVYRSFQLVQTPGPKAAMANFRASLFQLTILILGAMTDVWLLA
ncbi:MAG: heme o synthase [Fimbriimonadaceae bacterium]|nr:heme o synthase [Alphaproteobacteria bacterium]